MANQWRNSPFTSSSSSVNNDCEQIELFSREDTPIVRSTSTSSTTSSSPKSRLSLFLSIVFLIFLFICFVTILRFSVDLPKKSTEEPKVIGEETDLVFSVNNEKQSSDPPKCSYVVPNSRFDCHPDQPISEQHCLKRGCCWTDEEGFEHKNQTINTVPKCYFGEDFVGYSVKNVEEYYLKTVVTLERRLTSGFPRDSQTIKVEIISLNENSLRYRWFGRLLLLTFLRISTEFVSLIPTNADMKSRYHCSQSRPRQ